MTGPLVPIEGRMVNPLAHKVDKVTSELGTLTSYFSQNKELLNLQSSGPLTTHAASEQSSLGLPQHWVDGDVSWKFTTSQLAKNIVSVEAGSNKSFFKVAPLPSPLMTPP